jgi:AcrR family transcriptional regulator
VTQNHERSEATVTRKQTLRDVQKAQTRQRLLDAARSVFYREGYYGSTVDQIVAEAGASRPTFYLHFQDKEEVLDELMAAYMARAVPTMERLPGPRPTVEQLQEWLREVGKFLEQERALFSLVHQVSAHKPNRPANRLNYGLATTDSWINALSGRAPAFAAAVNGKGQDINGRACAELLVIDIVWAGANVVRDKTSAFTEETVTIVAKSLHGFINDPRFRSAATKGAPPHRRKAQTAIDGGK